MFSDCINSQAVTFLPLGEAQIIDNIERVVYGWPPSIRISVYSKTIRSPANVAYNRRISIRLYAAYDRIIQLSGAGEYRAVSMGSLQTRVRPSLSASPSPMQSSPELSVVLEFRTDGLRWRGLSFAGRTVTL